MERVTSLNKAKEILGYNFIGLEELKSIQKEMGIHIPINIKNAVPKIGFSEHLLKNKKNDYILILGIPFYKDGSPLTINKMREHFGWDPNISEPCFYNQDWYLKERFACENTFEQKWYLVKKRVFEEHRGKTTKDIENIKTIQLPSAILCSFVFYAYYFHSNKEILWKNDFIWCSDRDSNDDQIYVGRYCDSRGMNKNGFNIHRYLQINNKYSFIEMA